MGKAQFYLLDKSLDDLVLNPNAKRKDWVYASDAMEAYKDLALEDQKENLFETLLK